MPALFLLELTMNSSSLDSAHWMLQEILEQPAVVQTCLEHWGIQPSGQINPQLGLGLSPAEIQSICQVRIIGCGTSLHAGFIAKALLESEAKIPTTVHPASELRHTLPLPLPGTLTLAITQSGETADVLKGCLLLQAQDAGAEITDGRYVGITNQAGSSLESITQFTLVLPAGKEVSIAATKTFTATLVTLYGVVLALGQNRQQLAPEQSQKWGAALHQLPVQIAGVFHRLADPIAAIATQWKAQQSWIVLGRGLQAAIAMEAALKFKETAYIHAEGFASGEFLHGPIALLDATIPAIAIVMPGRTVEGDLAILPKLKARQAPLLVITTDSLAEAVRAELDERNDHLLILPDTLPELAPILTVLPLQLLAYRSALARNLNPDQPRGLVKSIAQD